MEPLTICFIVIFSLIILLFFPLLFSVKASLDACENLLFVKIKFFCFIVETIKQNLFGVNLKKKKVPYKFLIQFLKDIKIFKAQIFCEFGSRKITKTICVCGIINTLFFACSKFLRRGGVKLKYGVSPCFFKTHFKFYGEVGFCFTPINLLISFIKTKMKSKIKLEEKLKNAKK